VPDQDDLVELLEVEQRDGVLDVQLEVRVLRQQMPALAQTGELGAYARWPSARSASTTGSYIQPPLNPP
jgi:hypothetical protein